MMNFKRYAVYFAPRNGAFATHAARWLGWDVAIGEAVDQPRVPGLLADLHQITFEPRKYGFHGTIRAPFRLATAVDFQRVDETLGQLSAGLAPVECLGLRLEDLDGFLALTPEGCEAGLLELGAKVVEATEPMRAPLTPAERAKRRPERLTPRQCALLDRWGYPGVMEEFRFHLTLTGRLDSDLRENVAKVAQDYFGPVLPRPFAIEDLCLFGEDDAGRFHLLKRYALMG